MSDPDKFVLVVGCGYTGLELTQRLTFQGIPVVGTTRSTKRCGIIRTRGAAALQLDLSDLSPLGKIRGKVRAVVHMAPPTKGPEGSYVDQTTQLLEWASDEPLETFVYVSSTSVYGDYGGAEVDEKSPCRPDSPRGKKRLEIEQEVLNSSLPAIVVRPSGIYGPGRSMLHRLAERKYRLVAGGQATTNRIHVRDLATIIERAISHGEPGSTYLASDAMPTAQTELVDRLCLEFGVPRPAELSVEEASIRMPIDVLKMVMGSKKLNSEWTRSSLGVRLKYPDFLTGCRDIWNRERVTLEAMWSQGKS